MATERTGSSCPQKSNYHAGQHFNNQPFPCLGKRPEVYNNLNVLKTAELYIK